MWSRSDQTWPRPLLCRRPCAPRRRCRLQVLYFGKPGRPLAKSQSVIVVAVSDDSCHAVVKLRLPSGKEIADVPLSSLQLPEHADKDDLARARGSAKRAAQRLRRRERLEADADGAQPSRDADGVLEPEDDGRAWKQPKIADVVDSCASVKAGASDAQLRAPDAPRRDADGMLEPGDEVLFLGMPGHEWKKPKSAKVIDVHALVTAGASDARLRVRLRDGSLTEFADVTRSRLLSVDEAPADQLRRAREAARKGRERRARLSTAPSQQSVRHTAPAPALAPAPEVDLAAVTAGMSALSVAGATVADFTVGCKVLSHTGRNGHRLTLSQPGVVSSLDTPRGTATVQLTGSNRVVTVPVSELRLAELADADEIARADAAAERAGRRRRRLSRVVDASTAEGPLLVPTTQRLVQIATDAADAMKNISDRVPCGVCCCSVQVVDTVEVSVSEAPKPSWLAKLEATPDMNLHAELRAQYDLGADDAVDKNIHPQWRKMLLYPPSLYCVRTDNWAISACTSCSKSLDVTSTQKPPADSIANGNYRGFASLVPELAAVKEQVGCPHTPRLHAGVSPRFMLALTRLPCCRPRRCGRSFGTAFAGSCNASASPSTPTVPPPRHASSCRAQSACASSCAKNTRTSFAHFANLLQ